MSNRKSARRSGAQAAQSRAVQSQAAQSQGKPLLVTADESLLDAVLRLAAAANVSIELAGDAGAARSRWAGPPLVLVGADQAGSVASASSPRRPGVVLVGHEPDDPRLWQQAVQMGAENVALLPKDEPWLVDTLADVAEGSAQGSGQGATTIGVIGGRGGAGASVLAVGLAMTARGRGHATMLIDADPFGGGLDLLLGAEDVAGLRWPDLANTRGRLAGATLREHVPEPYGLGVLSWDRGSTLAVPDAAVSAVVGAAARACDVVIVDLPRPANPITELVLPRCTTTLLVVPADVRGVAAAARVAASVCTQTSDIRAVVRGPSPSGLRAGEVASSLGLPMAATYDAEAGLARELERGQPPGRSGRGALAAACSDVLDVVMRRPSRQARQ